jgi:hypothetical protein
MRRIATEMIPAKMIELQSFWDGAHKNLVD